MAVTKYYTYNGLVIGESTDGTHTSYGPDASGSVVATYAGGVPQNSYLWLPYGTLALRSGAAADPKFGWHGSSGYRSGSGSYSGFYVRTRHYDLTTGQWNSVDPLWPSQRPYAYANSSPASVGDPSGLAVTVSTNPVTLEPVLDNPPSCPHTGVMLGPFTQSRCAHNPSNACRMQNKYEWLSTWIVNVWCCPNKDKSGTWVMEITGKPSAEKDNVSCCDNIHPWSYNPPSPECPSYPPPPP